MEYKTNVITKIEPCVFLVVYSHGITKNFPAYEWSEMQTKRILIGLQSSLIDERHKKVNTKVFNKITPKVKLLSLDKVLLL